MDWLYVWSPRYRFFHEFLFSAIHDLSGFSIKPIFAEQSLFTPLPNTKHFLTGIPIKIYVILNYIKQNPGKLFFFTDCDLIVFPEFSYKDLDPYLSNDITCMLETHSPIPYNIGCLLIRCTPKTLSFFERVFQRIQTEKLLDQDAFHMELSSLEGTFGTFSPEHFLQSNMVSEDASQYKIIQCLCSETDPSAVLVEKVLSICSCCDISPLLHLLPENVQETLKTESGMS